MKYNWTVTLLSCSLLALFLSSCKPNGKQVECQSGINLLPMYGNVEKCPEQLETDKEFFAMIDNEEPNRSIASIHTLDNAWYHLRQSNLDMAIKRLNQAWLLDESNIAIYPSFAVWLALQFKMDEAKKMMELAFSKMDKLTDTDGNTPATLSKKQFMELIISHVIFVSQKSNTKYFAEYVFKRINQLDLPASLKQSLKRTLQTEVFG